MTDTVCSLQFKLSVALLTLEKIDRALNAAIPLHGPHEMRRWVKRTLREINGGPRLVAEGDERTPLTPDQHWHRQLEAMKAEMEKSVYLLSPNPVFKVGEE